MNVKKDLAFLGEEINQLKKDNLYRELFILDSAQQPLSIINSRKVVNLSSNNYLGLTTHPKVIQRAREYLEKWGAGTSAVRTIIGTMHIHNDLEKKIAMFKGTEASIVFQSGFATNVSVNQTIMTSEEDFIISDQLNHASIIDGARLAKAQRLIYKHKDMAELESHLKEVKSKRARRVLIVTDGVFSMDGDIAPLPDIAALAEKYGALIMVDDAHATGVVGKNGRGTPSHFDLTDQIHIQIGTLSKTIGAMGGYVASTLEVRDYFVQKARQFLFSSSHPPAVVGACMAAFEILETEPNLMEQLWNNTKYFKGRLKELGFNTGHSETPITPIIVGDSAKTLRFSDRLFEEGVFVQGIVFPTVPRGTERLRTIVTATHSKGDLDFAVDKIKKIGNELGVVK
ncbi:MAG: glycine C-acetyltransferase [Planctomycetes bacterium]|nr:glycine C-acetyltransferase [Planctomycetota bacterium]